MTESSHKQLECLFAWAAFYSNALILAKPAIYNKEMFNRTQKQIVQLEKQLNS